ncbi:MAG: hypothetical protein U1A78_18840 [Polyangia bacterium]
MSFAKTLARSLQRLSNPLRKHLGVALVGGALLASADATAFCGFFVSGADGELTNNASQVVLMRNATRIYNAA